MSMFEHSERCNALEPFEGVPWLPPPLFSSPLFSRSASRAQSPTCIAFSSPVALILLRPVRISSLLAPSIANIAF